MHIYMHTCIYAYMHTYTHVIEFKTDILKPVREYSLLLLLFSSHPEPVYIDLPHGSEAATRAEKEATAALERCDLVKTVPNVKLCNPKH